MDADASIKEKTVNQLMFKFQKLKQKMNMFSRLSTRFNKISGLKSVRVT